MLLEEWSGILDDSWANDVEILGHVVGPLCFQSLWYLKLTEVNLRVDESLRVSGPSLRVSDPIASLWMCKAVHVNDWIFPFFVMLVFSLIIIIFLDPLVNLDSPFNLHSVLSIESKWWITNLTWSGGSPSNVDQLVILIFTWLVRISFSDIFLGGQEELIKSYISSLVHPGHWNCYPDKNDTEDKFHDWVALRVAFSTWSGSWPLEVERFSWASPSWRAG